MQKITPENNGPQEYGGQPLQVSYGGPIMQQPSNQTTVIVTQQQVYEADARDWSSPICSCFDDMESCCCVFFFFPCYLSCLYSKYGECCCTPCCVPYPHMALRIQHRNRNKIQGTILNDCCVSTWCAMCSTCQVKRDMDYVTNTNGSLF